MRTRESDNYTNKKEDLGKKWLKAHWKDVYPEAKSIKWVTSKKLQIKGVDFIVTRKDGTTFTVDLKACQGCNYNMTIDDYACVPPRYYETSKGLPIELFYYNRGLKEWQFTNTKRKLTDEMLYIINDYSGIGYKRLSYQDVKNISHNAITSFSYKLNKFTGLYKAHQSNEKSAWYIKFPATLIYL